MKTLKELRDGSKNYSPEKNTAEYGNLLVDEIREVENIRTVYPEEGIRELAESIERDGLLQPIVVIENGKEEGRTVYKVIAGHRRLRAYQYLRALDKPTYNQIRALVRKDIEDIETLQLIENVQREDLSPSDLEKALKSIMKKEGLNQNELAQRVGKNKVWISKILGAERIREEFKKSFVDETFIENVPSTVLYEYSGIKDTKTRNQTIIDTFQKGVTQKNARDDTKKAKEKNREKKNKKQSSSDISLPEGKGSLEFDYFEARAIARAVRRVIKNIKFKKSGEYFNRYSGIVAIEKDEYEYLNKFLKKIDSIKIK